MAQQYKFEDPLDVVVISPHQGQIETNMSEAAVDYCFHAHGAFQSVCTIELSIDGQHFRVDDLDDLISFLQTARDKLVEQNNGH